jgi:predicted transcriptional regulator
MTDQFNILELTAEIVASHVANNNVATADVATLIQSVFTALTNAEQPPVVEAPKAGPAVPVRSSIKHDYIVCLEDGAKLKMLKRYLRTNYDTTPEQYRAKWDLPRDYPMVAPAYAETRRTLANSIGLGRKKVSDTVEAVEGAVAKPVKAAGKKLGIAAAKAAASAHLTGNAEPKKRGRPAKAKPVAQQETVDA